MIIALICSFLAGVGFTSLVAVDELELREEGCREVRNEVILQAYAIKELKEELHLCEMRQNQKN